MRIKVFILLFIIFNVGIAYSAVEDFSTYTETDPGSDITLVGSNSVDVSTMDRTRDAGVWKSHGASHFTDFDVTFVVSLKSEAGADFKQYPFVAFANISSPTEGDMDVANAGVSFNYFDDTAAPQYNFRVKDYSDNSADDYNFSNVPFTGCINFYRVGSDITAEIYTSSDCTTGLTDTVTTPAVSTAWEYVSVANGDEEGSSGDSATFWVKDLDLQEGGGGGGGSTTGQVVIIQ